MADCGCPSEIWLTAAFRTVRPGEYYLFMKKECALYEYGTSGQVDKIIRKPTPIGEVFPSLKCTIFADAGVDCAFASNNANKAYLFSYSQVAEFDYAPYGGDDRIVGEPMPISKKFPFLKGTVFENGIDAAFESTNRLEAYLFKGNMCARIDHSSANPHLVSMSRINEMFPILKNTSFENGGFSAAYTIIWNTEQSAALFKGDSMGHLHFKSGSTAGQVKWGPVKIKDSGKKNLASMLPRKNIKANAN